MAEAAPYVIPTAQQWDKIPKGIIGTRGNIAVTQLPNGQVSVDFENMIEILVEYNGQPLLLQMPYCGTSPQLPPA